MSVLSATEPQARSTSAAEPEEPASERERNWPIPPPEGFTANDLDRIPDLPPHTELIDGSLVFVSPHRKFHARMMSLIESQMWPQIPDEYLIWREMSMAIDKRQRPEPDMAIVHAAEDEDDEQTSVPAESVILAIEVVSPESEVRDRERKPEIYAKAGVPHFWRIEREDGKPAVYVYELDPATGAYVATGIHHDRIKVGVPFDIEVDLLKVRPV